MPTGASYDLQGRPLWGTSGGILYQYGRDSSGRDTFGPGTDEAGNPLGNSDGSMIGSQDPRHNAAAGALAQHPGYVQVRVNQKGAVGGYLDPSQLVYDPTVGLITPEGNINKGPDNTGLMMAAMLLGGPLIGAAGNAAFGAGAVGVPGTVGTAGVGADGIVAGSGTAGGTVGGTVGGSGLGNSIVGDDPAYPGTGNPNYTGPGEFSPAGTPAGPQAGEPGYQGPSGPDETPPPEPGEPGFQGPSGPDETIPEGSNYAPIDDHSVTRPWYQPFLDRFVTPGGTASMLSRLPALASALKPLVANPPPANGMSTVNNLSGKSGGSGQGGPQAHPFTAAQNTALDVKPKQPIRSLGDYLRGS